MGLCSSKRSSSVTKTDEGPVANCNRGCGAVNTRRRRGLVLKRGVTITPWSRQGDSGTRNVGLSYWNAVHADVSAFGHSGVEVSAGGLRNYR